MITFTPWSIDIPPSGWHFASADRNPELLRFWDGVAWSVAVHESAGEAELARCSMTPDATLADRAVWWRSLSDASLAWLERDGVRWHGAHGAA